MLAGPADLCLATAPNDYMMVSYNLALNHAVAKRLSASFDTVSTDIGTVSRIFLLVLPRLGTRPAAASCSPAEEAGGIRPMRRSAKRKWRGKRRGGERRGREACTEVLRVDSSTDAFCRFLHSTQTSEQSLKPARDNSPSSSSSIFPLPSRISQPGAP